MIVKKYAIYSSRIGTTFKPSRWVSSLFGDSNASYFNFFSRLEILLLVLVCCSLFLTLIPGHWFETRLALNPLDYNAGLTDDKNSNGTSVVEWLDQAKQKWKCTIGELKPRYCSLYLPIGSDVEGMDFSRFDEVFVKGEYEGSAETIRIYLRNAEDLQSDSLDILETRYNQIEIPVEDFSKGATVHVDNFSVADWWLVQKKIPPESSRPRIDNVLLIELQTSSLVEPGEHVFQLEKIVWRGKAFNEKMLYRSLVLFWPVVILLLLSIRLFNLKLRLNRNKREQQELIEVNKLLDLQNKEYVDLAKTDQLTAVANRFGIRDDIHTALKKWQVSGRLFSIILIDIDNFKRVNDCWGHVVGDQILSMFARVVSSHVGKNNRLARWGGEEFLIVCPGATLQQAQTLAELIRRKVEQANFHREFDVTASFGVAVIKGPDLDELFKAADQALYHAKASGRNRVCVERPKARPVVCS